MLFIVLWENARKQTCPIFLKNKNILRHDDEYVYIYIFRLNWIYYSYKIILGNELTIDQSNIETVLLFPDAEKAFDWVEIPGLCFLKKRC